MKTLTSCPPLAEPYPGCTTVRTTRLSSSAKRCHLHHCRNPPGTTARGCGRPEESAARLVLTRSEPRSAPTPVVGGGVTRPRGSGAVGECGEGRRHSEVRGSAGRPYRVDEAPTARDRAESGLVIADILAHGQRGHPWVLPERGWGGGVGPGGVWQRAWRVRWSPGGGYCGPIDTHRGEERGGTTDEEGCGGPH